MERSPKFGQPSAHHDQGFGGHLVRDTNPEHAYEATRMPTGDLPRMFALVQEFYEDDEGEEDVESFTEVVAYGLALPGGTVATVAANGSEFGRWTSAHNAARRLHTDLVWLGDGDTNPTP
ncbi:hypothetical protein GCM10022252_15730 [Streptosporangium oxazolinicum]|uniref:Uncharacterized protein n=1 Tax=Streptosporangium oxazolinicum TaxID=909287 RepID=A0ABP8AKE3_9ACTN